MCEKKSGKLRKMKSQEKRTKLVQPFLMLEVSVSRLKCTKRS